MGPIPADAGEPPDERTGEIRKGAYPRGRGGTAVEIPERVVVKGLSPRTRGNLPSTAAPIPASGPIPADAGEPGALLQVRRWMRAYPRGRGGTQGKRRSSGGETGLSPRTRGNRTPSSSNRPSSGPIPADAGEPLLAAAV